MAQPSCVGGLGFLNFCFNSDDLLPFSNTLRLKYVILNYTLNDISRCIRLLSSVVNKEVLKKGEADMEKIDFFEMSKNTPLKNIPNMPVGISSFEKIRKDGSYYVDKTNLIKDIVESSYAVNLFTRPRRFGKTLIMRMLESFFSIEKNSKNFFDGLNISKNTQLCNACMNQYPTVFLTLKDVDGKNYEEAFNLLREKISNLFKDFYFLKDSFMLEEDDKNLFNKLKSGISTELEVLKSLSTLVRLLHLHYEKTVILLIDEYDVPLAKASDKGYYDEMLNAMKIFMQVLKDNDYMEFAVITGCLRISKESIFTGTNNFYVNSITSNRYSEYFGFTKAEVIQMLTDANALAKYPEIKEWYDGYNFGGTEIYCPWDVINYVDDYSHGEKNIPKCYWTDTSDNAILRVFIDNYSNAIYDDFETLLRGGAVQKLIREELTYDLLHSSENNFWSILFLTGYLTSDVDEFLNKVSLRIPNKEIERIYNYTIKQWFRDSMQVMDRKNLLIAMWSGDTAALTQELSKILITTISFHDYKEDFYHAFLAGIFTGLSYKVKSNAESGEGRSDVVVKDRIRFRVSIFEVKHSAKRADMEKDCNRALTQIVDRKYAVEYEDEFDEIFCYGIAFYKKRCLVKYLNKK